MRAESGSGGQFAHDPKYRREENRGHWEQLLARVKVYVLLGLCNNLLLQEQYNKSHQLNKLHPLPTVSSTMKSEHRTSQTMCKSLIPLP